MMDAAAPRYAETPTPSRRLDRVMKDLTSVIPNEYWSSLVGVILAAVRASTKKLT